MKMTAKYNLQEALKILANLSGGVIDLGFSSPIEGMSALGEEKRKKLYSMASEIWELIAAGKNNEAERDRLESHFENPGGYITRGQSKEAERLKKAQNVVKARQIDFILQMPSYLEDLMPLYPQTPDAIPAIQKYHTRQLRKISCSVRGLLEIELSESKSKQPNVEGIKAFLIEKMEADRVQAAMVGLGRFFENTFGLKQTESSVLSASPPQIASAPPLPEAQSSTPPNSEPSRARNLVNKLRRRVSSKPQDTSSQLSLFEKTPLPG